MSKDDKAHPEIERIAREKIGEAIVIMMKERGITFGEMVQRSGVGTQQLAHLRTGAGNPTLSTFIKVLQVLDARLEIMFKHPEHTFPEMKLRRN